MLSELTGFTVIFTPLHRDLLKLRSRDRSCGVGDPCGAQLKIVESVSCGGCDRNVPDTILQKWSEEIN